MLSDVLDALVASPNYAADDVLLEVLQVGTGAEQHVAMDALLRRRSRYGQTRLIAAFAELPKPLQRRLLDRADSFEGAILQAARGDDRSLRHAVVKLVAAARHGDLAAVLPEALFDADATLAADAADALAQLADGIATARRRLRTDLDHADAEVRERAYRQMLRNRAGVQRAVARALESHPAKVAPALLRAAMLLGDHPNSPTLALAGKPKHGGQPAVLRRLQQPPEAPFVTAFLIGATHFQLRGHFANAVGQTSDTNTLEALLEHTHWLKDARLSLAVKQVKQGAWWTKAELDRELRRRTPLRLAQAAEWICAGGVDAEPRRELLVALKTGVEPSAAARLGMLRAVTSRRDPADAEVIAAFLHDPDERIARMAARELLTRRPPDYENILLRGLSTLWPSVRQLISRSVGRASFESYWRRFDQMDVITRRASGLAMLKLLPDGVERLGRRLASGRLDHRLRALQIVDELGLLSPLRARLVPLCDDPNPRVRSKAVKLLGRTTAATPEALLDRALSDTDARVRANAIEVLETTRRFEFLPLLVERAARGEPRERANAIKALVRLEFPRVEPLMKAMLVDRRPEHRISGVWAARHVPQSGALALVAGLARRDPNPRVRRYALKLVQHVAADLKKRKAA